MRKSLFQIHKWIGLTIAILVIPISLSGALLVWHDWLDAQINPARYAVSGGPLLQTPSTYIAAARTALSPDDRIASLRFEGADHPVVVMATPASKPGAKEGGGPPQRITLWLDPATGKLLDKASGNSGLVRFLHVLHGSLFVPGAGRQIVGWIGVAMLILSLSGIWLWWPTIGRWTKGLRWRRHRNFDTNLHHQTGFWIALPLAALSLTGAWISFPQFFASISGQPVQSRPPGGGRAAPLAETVQEVDSVSATAQRLLKGPPTAINWPTDKEPKWRISKGDRSASIDDATGDAKAKPPEPETLARLMRRIHDGTGMGAFWQTIIFIGGILPVILAITGVIMWWRARGWRGDLDQRRAKKRSGATAARS